MLTCLRVRSLAVIDDVEVELGPGLNVVTGETGAGKSVLIRALELVLGGRARGDLVRAGADRAEVEALFEGPGIRARLEAAGLDPDDQLAVHRTISAGGRSRVSLNGRLATVAQLGRLVSGLVDISSQHEHHTLLDPATHLVVLDAYAGLVGARGRVAHAVVHATRALEALREVQRRLTERVGREDLLRYQVGEIDKLGPRPGEEDALAEQVGRLRHAAELSQAALRAEHALQGADGAICGRVTQVIGALQRAARLDPRLEGVLSQLRCASAELEDAARELGRYGAAVEGDPRRLAEVEERLELLKRLTRRYGATVEEVLAYRDRARIELSELDDLDEAIERARGAFEAQREAAGAEARALSSARREAATGLARAFADELAALGMGSASVRVEVAPVDGADAAMQVDGARLQPTGIDRVEFRIAPNPGVAPLPLGQVASGGELSRALLGLKCVLAGTTPGFGLYVFDEIDTGVGGAIAEVIGRKIAEVSRSHQVLCITHLPQIAAFADRHLRVTKRIGADTTETTMEVLGAEARVDELARMLGGLRITETTRRAASEMVVAARA